MIPGIISVFRRILANLAFTKIVNPQTPSTSDRFASSLSLANGSVLIGNSGADISFTNAGVAYVYQKVLNEWALTQTINNPVPEFRSNFGSTVCSSPGYACIVSNLNYNLYQQTNMCLNVYSKSETAWTLQASITHPEFGQDIGNGFKAGFYNEYGPFITDDHLATIGVGLDGVKVYVYKRTGSTWSLQTALMGPFAIGERLNYKSVAIDSDNMAVSFLIDSRVYNPETFNYEGGEIYYGVHVFTLSADTWSYTQTIVSPHPYYQDGQSTVAVAIKGEYMAVGWPYSQDTTNIDHTGSVSIYRISMNGEWELHTSLVNPHHYQWSWYGEALSFSGNRLLVGAYGDDVIAEYKGTVYLYELNNSAWLFKRTIASPNTAGSEGFGYRLTLDGNDALIYEYYDYTIPGTWQANAYVFDLSNA